MSHRSRAQFPHGTYCSCTCLCINWMRRSVRYIALCTFSHACLNSGVRSGPGVRKRCAACVIFGPPPPQFVFCLFFHFGRLLFAASRAPPLSPTSDLLCSAAERVEKEEKLVGGSGWAFVLLARPAIQGHRFMLIPVSALVSCEESDCDSAMNVTWDVRLPPTFQ